MRWVVMKFGGTSVAGARQWATIARLVESRRSEGFHVLLVCSAIAGTTDELVAIDCLADPRPEVDSLLERHAALASSLKIDAADKLSEANKQLSSMLESTPSPARTARLLALGEWLSTQLGALYLASQNHPVRWVDAREALLAIKESKANGRRQWMAVNCQAGYDEALVQRWGESGAVLITQGFVARNDTGATVLLGRGGSDTSAALLGSRLGAERTEIWTDVPGLFSADPRKEPAAKLISHLAWDEALEMAASGARVIHGRSIRAAAQGQMPLWIKDLNEPELPGTVIGEDSQRENHGNPAGPENQDSITQDDRPVRAIVVQPGMLVLLLENLDTRQQVGFLAGVFNRISELGISVDQVATSETTTTLAINTETNALDDAAERAVIESLQGLCSVDAFPGRSCVSLVGRGARRALAELGVAQRFFREHPLYMMSHSANDLSISLLLDPTAAEELARLLHQELVVGA